MTTNDINRWKCVNNQLCEQLCTKLHKVPPKKWHRADPPAPAADKMAFALTPEVMDALNEELSHQWT